MSGEGNSPGTVVTPQLGKGQWLPGPTDQDELPLGLPEASDAPSGDNRPSKGGLGRSGGGGLVLGRPVSSSVADGPDTGVEDVPPVGVVVSGAAATALLKRPCEGGSRSPAPEDVVPETGGEAGSSAVGGNQVAPPVKGESQAWFDWSLEEFGCRDCQVVVDRISIVDSDSASSVDGRSRSRVGKRTRDESLDSLSGAEEETATKKSATATERRGRGRPVTTGARAKKAEARELLREDRKRARAEEAEEEAEGFSIRLRKALNMAEYKVREQTASELIKAVRTATETIAHCTRKSGNISGVFQRNLNDATALIQAAIESLAERTVSDEIRRLNLVVERLAKENTELRKESAILKEQQSREAVVPPSTETPMEVTPAGVEPSELERNLTARWSAMINARFEGLEDRLLPEKRRIPLAADQRSEARPSFAEVAGPSKVQPAKAKTPAPKAPAAKAPVAKAPAAKAPSAKAAVAKAPAAKAPATKAPVAKAPVSKALAAKTSVEKTPTAKAPSAKALPAKATTSAPNAPTSKRQGRSRARRSPPRASAPATEARPLPPPPSSMEEGWTTVAKRGKKGQKAAQPPRSGTKPTKPAAAKPATPKLRPPRSSAIVLTLLPGAQEKGVTYETAIRDAKSRINLEELGISGLRFSKAKTGGKILEIPGATSGDKADAFATKLREVLPAEIVRVTRPTKTVDIRLSGLDDSVTKEEVAEAVSKSGGCTVDHVKVGVIRQSWSGSGTVVVKVPVTAAQKLSKGRLLVGWVSCRVQVLETKPLRCYRCMEGGHVRGQCPCETDRSELCYRCGRPGHQARECDAAAPHCPVCADLGKPADHKVGSKNCAPPKRGKASKPVPSCSTGETTVAMDTA
ncbi:hypothetical protein ABMA28_017220 [Loxostege sticticalis]|uniref:CCHC-type domain-containing protein n=1 Tax=Loxostege sticticalis TaxID=481309 RepID=A0ABD0S495_LOXSC